MELSCPIHIWAGGWATYVLFITSRGPGLKLGPPGMAIWMAIQSADTAFPKPLKKWKRHSSETFLLHDFRRCSRIFPNFQHPKFHVPNFQTTPTLSQIFPSSSRDPLPRAAAPSPWLPNDDPRSVQRPAAVPTESAQLWDITSSVSKIYHISMNSM